MGPYNPGEEGVMAEFSLWSRVERCGTHYVARVSAIPCGPMRCAPEERARDCGTHAEAEAAAAALCRELARDLHARGARTLQEATEEAHA
jgi:hypothetical protein